MVYYGPLFGDMFIFGGRLPPSTEPANGSHPIQQRRDPEHGPKTR